MTQGSGAGPRGGADAQLSGQTVAPNGSDTVGGPVPTAIADHDRARLTSGRAIHGRRGQSRLRSCRRPLRRGPGALVPRPARESAVLACRTSAGVTRYAGQAAEGQVHGGRAAPPQTTTPPTGPRHPGDRNPAPARRAGRAGAARQREERVRHEASSRSAIAARSLGVRFAISLAKASRAASMRRSSASRSPRSATAKASASN